MSLTKLEMYGFKSFADKTNFIFSPGITAFVGPNGCGKSNVVDAVRWVLGEQNPRTIRAGKMEDVIFVGSDPEHYKNYAEVSIVLDNSAQKLPLEYNEITITRRLYKSGESEYFINKTPCRLKDINQLLAATSLSGGSYAIIGQGQVEEVIHSKPEDRREMFEQAAGITLYKIRKKEAGKKLADTRSNLTRIDDIIHELENQREEVSESADRASRYLQLKEEADRHEVNLWSVRFQDIANKSQALSKRHQQLQTQQAEKQTLLGEQETKLAEVASGLDELNGLVAVLDQKKAALAEQRNKLEYQKELACQRRQDYSSMVKQAEESGENVARQLAHLKERLESNSSKVSALEGWLEKLNQAHQNRDRFCQVLDRFTSATAQLETKTDNLLMDNAVLESQASARQQSILQQVEEVQSALVQAGEEKEALEHKLKELAGQQQQGQQQCRELEQRRQQLFERQQQLKQSIKERADRAEGLEQKRLALQGKLMANQERVEMLDQLEQHLQGYSQGPRAVLQAADQGKLTGLLGSLAQLIEVVNPEHNLAIETALGSALQFLVCSTEENCKDAIELLKKNAQGRATFIPLDAPHSTSGQHGDYRTKIIGRADQLVRCQQSLLPVVRRFLGNVYVVPDLDAAVSLARESNYRHKIVTLEGDLANRGLYTGGQSGNKQPGPLQRRNLIARLEQENSQLTSQLKELAHNLEQVRREEVQALAGLESVVAETEETGEELARAQNNVQGLLLHMEQIEAGLSGQKQRLDSSTARLGELNSELSQWKNKAVTGEEQLTRLRTFRQNMQHQLTQLQERTRLAAASRNKLQLLLLSLENKLNNLRGLKQQQLEQVNESARLIADATEQQEQYKGKISALGDELDKLEQELAENSAQGQQVVSSLESKETERQALKDKMSRLNQTVASSREEINQIRSSLHDGEVKLARWQTEQQAMSSELGHRLGITVEEALQQADEKINTGELQTALKKLRAEMEDLGEVNLASIQQHQRLEQRLGFLSRQRDDLDKAEKDITGLVDELNEKIRELFLDTFGLVQQKFAEVFSTLFDGGDAYLSLTDSDNVLETGVEIFARPPGKRTQSLSLLSGGEKAMTSIALLFALQSVRPSPFCILDEIEAALDDVNILRFSRYVRKLAREMQFILITHRRETMEHSDSLYGITLGADGSSQPVSVSIDGGGSSPDAAV